MKKNRVEWLENIRPTCMKVKASFPIRHSGVGLLLTITVGVTGCAKKEESLPRSDALVSVYVDILEVRKDKTAGIDSVSAIDSILKASGFSRESFLMEVESRAADPEQWKRFYEEAGRILEEREKEKQDTSSTKLESPAGPS